MTKQQTSECEIEFRRWERFLDPPFEEKPIKWWLKLGFEYSWNLRQQRITALESDNQKLREALEEIQIKLNAMAGHRMMQIANPARQVLNIAKAALAETKEEK